MERSKGNRPKLDKFIIMLAIVLIIVLGGCLMLCLHMQKDEVTTNNVNIGNTQQGQALAPQNEYSVATSAIPTQQVVVDRSTPENVLMTLSTAIAALDKQSVSECFNDDEIRKYLVPNEVFEASSAALMYRLDGTVRSGSFVRVDIYANLHWASITKMISAAIYMKQSEGQWKIVDVRREKRLTSSSENLESNTVYILSDSTGTQYFSRIENYELKYGALMTYSVAPYYGFAEDVAVVRPIPQINCQNGDLLVTTRAMSSYNLYKVKSVRYCYPYPYFGSYSTNWSSGYLKNVERINDIAYVGEKEISALADIPVAAKEQGITEQSLGLGIGTVLVSENPIELDIGYYQGTNYHESKLPVTSLLYRMDAQVECPVKRTKNGYSVIDISELPTGKYVIDANGKYVIEILN